jgi:hypothetical protein
MTRTRPFILWIYLIGVVMCESLLRWNAYDNGGFQRHHTLADLVVLAGFYLAAGLLWPIVFVMGALQYFGLLPH